MLRFLMIFLLLPATVWAADELGDDYVEPARGSETRRALMDAIRPHAEWNLAAPVEFVV
ncbi:MAG: hypothetical protein ACI8YI_002357 [Paracoccaceae bacterium]|jgi:hypothetical protein